MENKLDIRKETRGSEQYIFLDGRLDASWAGHLDDYLNGLVRDGSYYIVLNMNGVQYLSSAGIRILVNQYKKIKKIGGLFLLDELSATVSEVLTMVGMIGMLTERVREVVIPKAETSRFQELNNYRFEIEKLTGQPMKLQVSGDPGLSLTSGYTSSDNQKIKCTNSRYGLGIGAIGDGYEDCKSRYGEFLILGNALVYKPSDGSRIPDYAIKTGELNPEINALCYLQAEGAFSDRITFEPTGIQPSISLEEIVSGLAVISGYKQFVYLLIAETDGLVGVSLSAPPVDGKPLFEFPAIRENINFTTEPAYSKMLTVSLGFYVIQPDEKTKPYLRADKPGSSAFIHTHAAVFPFQSLPKKELSADKLIRHIFESSIVQDVMHLIHDSREIVGLGDSTFKQGVVWISELS
jgi:anti-anti-sigma factor